MQDISEILKFQMAKESCSPLCAFLLIGEYENESLQSTDKQMADANNEQWNQLGSGSRGCESISTNT